MQVYCKTELGWSKCKSTYESKPNYEDFAITWKLNNYSDWSVGCTDYQNLQQDMCWINTQREADMSNILGAVSPMFIKENRFTQIDTR